MIRRGLAAPAAIWVVLNAAVVYLWLGGERTHRIESACLLFAAVVLGLAIWDLRRRQPAEADASLSEGASLPVVVRAAGFAAWLAVMWMAIDYPFLSDDYVFLERYADWHSLGASAAGQFFRPVFAIVFWLFAPHGWALHALGVLLHLGSCELVRRLSLRAFSPRVAGLAALLFLLNPLQLEAVLWVSGLQELLWTFFVLAALWVYSREQTLRVPACAASLVLVGLALGSKETAVCAPALFAGLDWLLYRLRRGRQLPVMYGLLVGLVLLYVVVRSWFVVLDPSVLEAPTLFFVKQFVSNPYKLFVQPWNASVASIPGVVPFACVATAVFFTYWTAIQRRNWMPPLVAVFTVLASTIPLYRYFYVGAELEAARYLYFGSIGWSVFVAASVESVWRTRRAFAIAGTALLCVSVTFLALNLRPWKTAATLVRAMEMSAKDGRDPAASAREWAAQTGAPVQFEAGVPREIQGVNVFLNGYPEFVRMMQQRKR